VSGSIAGNPVTVLEWADKIRSTKLETRNKFKIQTSNAPNNPRLEILSFGHLILILF
jgi:hypothetical protein